MAKAKLVIEDKKRGPFAFNARLFLDGVEQKDAVSVSDCICPGWLDVEYAGGYTLRYYVTECEIVDRRKVRKGLFEKFRKIKKPFSNAVQI